MIYVLINVYENCCVSCESDVTEKINGYRCYHFVKYILKSLVRGAIDPLALVKFVTDHG